MARRLAAVAAVAALVVVLASVARGADAARALQQQHSPASPSPPPSPAASSGWVEGRATWYEDNKQGACQYKDKIPKYYAAMSDSNAPSDGVAYDSCGSCYAVQCVPGTVVDRYGELLSRWEFCNGGGVSEKPGSDPPTVIVKITDACPCIHSNYASNQRWCCGDQPHIDLGAEAFAHLAQASKGVVRARWRRISCEKGNGPVSASSVV